MDRLHSEANSENGLRALIENAKEIVRDEVYMEMYQEMQKKLKEIGKSGYIYLTSSQLNSGSTRMFGEINGLKIEALIRGEHAVSVEIEGETVNADLAMEIIENYSSIALNKDHVEYNVNEIFTEHKKQIIEDHGAQEGMIESQNNIESHKEELKREAEYKVIESQKNQVKKNIRERLL